MTRFENLIRIMVRDYHASISFVALRLGQAMLRDLFLLKK